MLRLNRVLLAISTLLPAAGFAQSFDLEQYAGVYRYRDNSTIVLVPEKKPDGERLVAMIGEAKYPLRFIGRDRFMNGVGDTIPFVRDTAGDVSRFNEAGTWYSRLTPVVPPAARLLTVPRSGAQWHDGYRAPAPRGDGLHVRDLQRNADSTAVDGMIRRVVDRTYDEVHGILVHHRGALIVEEYFYGYDRERLHELRSATKSVISLLAGIAIDRRLLPHESAAVLPLLAVNPALPRENPDPRKSLISLRDLLTMRSGLACNDDDGSSPGKETRLYRRPDWIGALLDLPLVAEPGTQPSYCSGGALAVGRAVENGAHQSLTDFARETLFSPLGIPASAVAWNFSLDSSNAGSFAQLRMRPRDMLKIGVMVLDRGRWLGQRIVPEDWIDRSTRQYATIGSRGYGYLWWHQQFEVASGGQTIRVATISASGNGGQKVYVIPSLDAVVVFTGGAYNNGNSAPNLMMPREVLPLLLSR